MNNATDIFIPRETVNDDFVDLLKWNFQLGQKINKGETVATVETSKIAVDIESPDSGYLEILIPVGNKIPVGSLIGRIHVNPISQFQPALPSQKQETQPDLSKPRISKKAQLLIEQYKINDAVFSEKDFVRESDVLLHLKTKDAKTQSTTGGFFSDAKKSAQDRGCNLFELALNYLFRNYLLGLLARIAPRGLNIFLHRMRGVKIGKGTFIDPTAVIETAYPENVIIGSDVRITAHAVIMSHIKASYYLRESGIMPSTIKKVTLEDHCFIGVNSVVMPGVTVGRASVVASGSIVFSSVPPHVMVAGNPAKIVKQFLEEKET